MRPRVLLCVVFSSIALAACSADPEVAKQDYLKSGDKYVAEGKLNEAIIEYRNAIQQDPRYGEARYKLAEALWTAGDQVGAYREYMRAADLLPQDAEVQVKAGQMNLAAGQFEDARSRADKAIEADAKNATAFILRGNALAGLKQYDAAVEDIEAAIKVDPNRSLSFAALGGVRLLQGDKAASEASFKRAIALDPKLLQPRIALANFYWLNGQRDAAEATLKEALAANPRDVAVNRSLAYLYVSTGRGAQAESYLKVIAEDTTDPQAQLALADYYDDAKRTADAVKVLDRLIADPKTATLGKTRMSTLLFEQGKKAEAYKMIDETLQKNGSDPGALLAKAQFLTTDRKFDDALKLARAAEAADPGSLLAHFGVARIQAARGEREDAIAEYNEALKLRPRFPIAQTELAALYLTAGRTDEALRTAQAALVSDPGNAEALLVEVRALLAKGDVNNAKQPLAQLTAKYGTSPRVQAQVGILRALENNRPAARKAFAAALAGDPVNVDALTGLVTVDLAEKNPQAARAAVEMAMSKDPNNVPVLLTAARTYASAGDPAAAERTLKQAIAVAPSNFIAYDLLGRLYASQGKTNDAIAEFTQIVNRQPRSVSAHTMIGVLLESQNKRDEARKRYEQVIAIDPHAPVAANNLAWIYAETGGNLDVALQLAQTAKAELPDTPEVDDTLGWVYYKKGLHVQAVASFRQSVDKDPKNATYMTHLGLAYAKSGDFTRGRQTLRDALKDNGNPHAADEARKVLNSMGG